MWTRVKADVLLLLAQFGTINFGEAFKLHPLNTSNCKGGFRLHPIYTITYEGGLKLHPLSTNHFNALSSTSHKP